MGDPIRSDAPPSFLDQLPSHTTANPHEYGDGRGSGLIPVTDNQGNTISFTGAADWHWYNPVSWLAHLGGKKVTYFTANVLYNRYKDDPIQRRRTVKERTGKTREIELDGRLRKECEFSETVYVAKGFLILQWYENWTINDTLEKYYEKVNPSLGQIARAALSAAGGKIGATAAPIIGEKIELAAAVATDGELAFGSGAYGSLGSSLATLSTIAGLTAWGATVFYAATAATKKYLQTSGEVNSEGWAYLKTVLEPEKVESRGPLQWEPCGDGAEEKKKAGVGSAPDLFKKRMVLAATGGILAAAVAGWLVTRSSPGLSLSGSGHLPPRTVGVSIQLNDSPYWRGELTAKPGYSFEDGKLTIEWFSGASGDELTVKELSRAADCRSPPSSLHSCNEWQYPEQHVSEIKVTFDKGGTVTASNFSDTSAAIAIPAGATKLVGVEMTLADADLNWKGHTDSSGRFAVDSKIQVPRKAIWDGVLLATLHE